MRQLPVERQASNRQPRTLALTFDDLPYVFIPPESAQDATTAVRNTSAILDTLHRHGAQAVAFVNEGKLAVGAQRDTLVAILKGWVASGAINSWRFFHTSS